jgi:hypothetical protein
MENHSVLETAILEMGRIKGENSFLPSEVAQWIYPQDWRYFMPELLDAMMALYKKGKIMVTLNGDPIDPKGKVEGPIRITLIEQTK